MICFFNWLVKITGYLPQRLVFRTKVFYEDAKAQARCIKGPAIVIANHTTVMDYAMLIFLFFTRTLRCQVAEMQFDRFFLSRLLKLLGAIRVDRSFQDMSSVAKSETILRRGGVVVIFPEGRLPREGEEVPLPFKTGAAYLALNTQAPIVPVYTNGCYFSRKRAKVAIGKPIHASELYDKNKSERENLQDITRILQEKTYGLRTLTENRQPTRQIYAFVRNCMYIIAKATAAIPALVWLRPKWIRVNRKERFIRGGALIVANHNSFYDPVALMTGIFYRKIRFVATCELFEGRFKNWLFGSAFQCICIDRNRLQMQTMREVNAALKNNEAVALFPEGHVLIGEGAGSQTMHSGMVLMAAQAKCPIVPVYILTPAKWYNRLRIAIGDAIVPQTGGSLPTLNEMERITDEVATSVRELRTLCENDLNRRKNEEKKG